jgi:heptosyltransferase III
MNRILVIRGGAIGDFVLTLPAIKMLRDRFPSARLEIIGVPHIVALADKRFYADAVRSLDSPALARFFVRDAELPADLATYFASFDLVLSYLHDPETIFESNVRKCSPATFIAGPSKLENSEHAAAQLTRPLQALGLSPNDPAPQLFPTDADHEAVSEFKIKDAIAIHPGSGSETKSWPIENWIELGERLLTEGRSLLVIAGEADAERAAKLRAVWRGRAVRFAENLPLPHLAALLESAHFIGHDSGISHVAAAVGARCLLLFGPTDPAIWAPPNENVTVLRTSDCDLRQLKVDDVAYELMRIGIRT